MQTGTISQSARATNRIAAYDPQNWQIQRIEDAERAFFRQARGIVADLFQTRPWIYWTDMLVTVTVAYSAAAVFLATPGVAWHQAIALVISGFALFRAGSFIHEIQHFRQGKMRGFTVAWNIVCGIPMMTPSFMYENHAGHHRHDTYGTIDDGEYLPLGRGRLGYLTIYLAEALLLPGLVALRFLALVPLSFLHPQFRRIVLERFSYFGINPHYRRQLPATGGKAWWAWLDVACCLRAWTIMAVVATGAAPWTHILKLYALGVIGLGLNYVRNLTAHHYRSDGRQMSYFDQLVDSVNVVGTPLLTELWFPVGLRYHALHHLLPALPYHNLGIAHRRLAAQLPADSPYHATVYAGFFAALTQLWRDARATRAA